MYDVKLDQGRFKNTIDLAARKIHDQLGKELEMNRYSIENSWELPDFRVWFDSASVGSLQSHSETILRLFLITKASSWTAKL